MMYYPDDIYAFIYQNTIDKSENKLINFKKYKNDYQNDTFKSLISMSEDFNSTIKQHIYKITGDNKFNQVNSITSMLSETTKNFRFKEKNEDDIKLMRAIWNHPDFKLSKKVNAKELHEKLKKPGSRHYEVFRESFSSDEGLSLEIFFALFNSFDIFLGLSCLLNNDVLDLQNYFMQTLEGIFESFPEINNEVSKEEFKTHMYFQNENTCLLNIFSVRRINGVEDLDKHYKSFKESTITSDTMDYIVSSLNSHLEMHTFKSSF